MPTWSVLEELFLSFERLRFPEILHHPVLTKTQTYALLFGAGRVYRIILDANRIDGTGSLSCSLTNIAPETSEGSRDDAGFVWALGALED